MVRQPQVHSPGPSTSRTPNKSRHSQSSASGSAKRKSSQPKKKTPVRKPRKRPGVQVLKDIRKLQSTTNLSIRKLPFSRVVREIQYKINPRISAWQSLAIQALHEAAEAYLVRFFEDCNLAATFTNRVTVMTKDAQFIRKLRHRDGTE
uniref:Histone H3.3-like n=1 Tax=Ciona intestinalis TaxID=7719 RepID=F7BNG7_CIOIN|nr:histone H3.3-like [Ciona intestinalis]|eukprot:XP_002128910.1 histone H3.3-like [Ciona intestinalis]